MQIKTRGLKAVVLGVAVLVGLMGVVGVAPALAGPVWKLDAFADTPAAPGSTVSYRMSTADVGDADAEGSVEPIVESVTLPAGLSAVGAQVYTAAAGRVDAATAGWACDDGNGGPIAGGRVIRCGSATNNARIIGFGVMLPELVFVAKLDPGAQGVLTASFEVSGGGAATAGSTVRPITVSSAPAAFGLAAFDVLASDANGEPSTQAGGHPSQVTTTLDFNTRDESSTAKSDLRPVAAVKDVLADLPAGLIGDPGVLAQCTEPQLAHGVGFGSEPLCPAGSQVGTVTLHFNGEPGASLLDGPYAVFNVAPPPGVPARFGFAVKGTVVTLDARVHLHTGPDGSRSYGLSVDSRGISEALGVDGVRVTFWGNPADSSHDHERVCTSGFCKSTSQQAEFLRNPTSCTPPGRGLGWTVHADSWGNPGRLDASGAADLSDPAWQTASLESHELPGYPYTPAEWGDPVGITGCDAVPFTPSIQVTPTSNAPASPAGLNVALSVPQEALTSTEGVAQADLKRVVVRLPEGMSVNPSSADGLGACSLAQIGLDTTTEPSCPDSSKVGSVEIKTPLLEAPLEGSIYLASQTANPFGSLLALYMVADGPGFSVKFPGRVELDALTGRLTATFDGLPQLPVSEVAVGFKTGSRAPLVTPSVCGSTAVESVLEGWNGKTVSQSTPYTVDCTPGLGGFSPSFVAGTSNPQAGAFSPLSVSFARNDGEQDLSGLTMKTPPGLLGMLKSVTRCGEPDASQGACGDGSLIGHVTVDAGAGSDPFQVPGKVFLTGPYAGAPFGLSIVVPAIAGPFDLGTVVVRARIIVDPHTAQITVISDAMPSILQGIPLLIKTVNVSVDRAGFIFNPSNCSPLSVSGTIASTEGATVGVSSRFEAANCATLGFHPGFQVSTQAKTSRASGASLHVHVTSGAGQTNIGKVVVSLPKQLPSWLPTLQKACVDSVFEQNPAACPAASVVGTATAVTPVLGNALSGPAYLVSHGGAAFPDLVVVLQGEGITLDLDGQTSIKGKVTTSSFNTVPDAPISAFDLTLPEGPHHVLAAVLPAKAKHSLCGQTLTMPTTITGQNGAIVKQSTKIAVTGCTKTKKKPKKHKKTAVKHKKKG